MGFWLILGNILLLLLLLLLFYKLIDVINKDHMTLNHTKFLNLLSHN